MTPTGSRFTQALPLWLSRPLGWLCSALGFVFRVVLLAWATLAIHFSNLPWQWVRSLLAVAFLVFGIWALWLTRRPHMGRVFAAVFLGVCVWWSFILPSHQRPWRPEVAVMPRASIDGDRVRITGVRNFEYRSRNDFTERYEEREVSISHLTGLDFYLSFWAEGPVGHTFVSFIFDNAPPLSISIETRPEVGEGFAPVSSLFKQFELIYVVGDEQDLVGSRASHRGEEIFLYRIKTPIESVRQLFLIYLERINQLADEPEFYHLLSNSCTINIVRYANAVGRQGRLELRHLLNGWVDGYLYASGRLDSSLPFEELRRRSRITATAKAAEGSADFSERIRESLPGMQP